MINLVVDQDLHFLIIAALCYQSNSNMKTYLTTDLLEQLKAQTEALLDKAIKERQMIPSDMFSTQPSATEWSATQCLSHLNGYGKYYLPLLEAAIRKASQGNKLSETFTPGWLGEYFTNLMQPKPDGTVSKKMKAPKQNIPPANENSDEVIALFIEQQEKMLQLLNTATGVNLGRRQIPISIAKFIRLKTGDVFRFVVAHNVRHVAQVERALSKVSKTSIRRAPLNTHTVSIIGMHHYRLWNKTK